MKKLTISLIFFIFMINIAGCTCDNTISSTSISTLADTSWLFQKYGEPSKLTTVSSSISITLNFRGLGGFDGSTGINNYGGGCRIEDNKIAIISLTQTTQQDPYGLVYLDLLRQATSFELTKNQLIIKCQNGQELVFEAKK